MDADERAKKARIEALKDTAAWADLSEVLLEIEEKFWKRHRADLTAGIEIDQAKLQRALGKFDGIRVLLNAPAKAAEILLREQSKENAA